METKEQEEKLGIALSKVRKDLGLTLIEVSKRTGIAQSQLSRMENAETQITAHRLFQLAQEYKTTPEVLLAGTAEAPLADTELNRIGEVIEFIEEMLAGSEKRPSPQSIRKTVISIYKKEAKASYTTGKEFDPEEYRDIVEALLGE